MHILPFENALTIIGINQYGLTQILAYLFISIPLLLAIFYFSTIIEINKYIQKHVGNYTLSKLIRKELVEDKNLSLSIFLGSKFLAISIIISHAMVFNIIGVVLFSVIAYILQVITVYVFEKAINIEDFMRDIIEEQNVSTAVLYGFMVVGLSMLIGTSLI